MIAGAEFEEGDRIDVTLSVDEREPKSGKRAYVARGTDSAGRRVAVTVFENNLPPVELAPDSTYELVSVEAEEPWGNDPADYGVTYERNSTVQTETDRERDGRYRSVAAAPLGDRIDVDLDVRNVELSDRDSVAYWATCDDPAGDTVMLTVFENNQPGAYLQEGDSYRFRDVEVERWDDGTLGVKFMPASSLEPLTDTESTNASEEPAELMINAIEADEQRRTTSRSRGFLSEVQRWIDDLPDGAIAFFSGFIVVLPVLLTTYANRLTPIEAGIVLSGVFLLGVLVNYARYRPDEKLRHRRKRKHVRVFLKALQQDYFEVVDTDTPVRANVMTKAGSSLSVFSYAGEYAEKELDLSYSVEEREGPWGRAFSDGAPKNYDRELDRTNSFSSAQQDIVTFQSCLSVPIRSQSGRKRDVIAVLTVDSDSGLDETQFDTEEVERLVTEYADLIGEVLE